MEQDNEIGHLPEAPPTDVAPSPVSDVPVPQIDDLEASLREFDEATADSSLPAPPVSGNGSPMVGAQPDPEMQADALKAYLGQVAQIEEIKLWAHGINEERLAEREQQDIEWALAKGRETISGIEHLPEDYADRFLRNQYAIDPELHNAWNNRHKSANALRWCNNCLRHAFKALFKEAKLESQRIAGLSIHEDRGAIVAFMAHRGRGTGVADDTPPKFGELSNREFQEGVKKKYGYTPRV